MILELWAGHLIILFQTTLPQIPLAGCRFPLSPPIIVMAKRSPLSDIINKKMRYSPLFRAQVNRLDRTLDKVFGSYNEDVPAGPAAASVKQPNQFASVAAASKLEKDASDYEVERAMRETCENLPLGAGHWQHDDVIVQDDPAEDDHKPAADRKPPPLPLRKKFQSIIGCDNPGLFVKLKEIVKKGKKRYDSMDIPKVRTSFCVCFSVPSFNIGTGTNFTFLPSKSPTKVGL